MSGPGSGSEYEHNPSKTIGPCKSDTDGHFIRIIFKSEMWSMQASFKQGTSKHHKAISMRTTMYQRIEFFRCAHAIYAAAHVVFDDRRSGVGVLQFRVTRLGVEVRAGGCNLGFSVFLRCRIVW